MRGAVALVLAVLLAVSAVSAVQLRPGDNINLTRVWRIVDYDRTAGCPSGQFSSGLLPNGSFNCSVPAGGGGAGVSTIQGDGYITVANGSTTNVSANLAAFDLRYVLNSVFSTWQGLVYANVTGVQAGVASVNATAVSAQSAASSALSVANAAALGVNQTNVTAVAAQAAASAAQAGVTSVNGTAVSALSVANAAALGVNQTNATIQNLLTSNTSTNTRITTVNATVQNLLTSNTSAFSAINGVQANVTSVNNTLNARINAIPVLTNLTTNGVLVASNSTNVTTDAEFTYNPATNTLFMNPDARFVIRSNTTTSNAHTVDIFMNTTGAADTAALQVTSLNSLHSAALINSNTASRGALKIEHTGNTTTTAASALSILLQGTNTAAQGIFVDTNSGNTGNLITLRSNGTDEFRVEADGDTLITGRLTVTGVNDSLVLGGGSNGDHILLDGERDWAFGTNGTGATTNGFLQDRGNDKNFDILTQDGDTRIARFFASNTDGNSRVFLVPDNGRVGVNVSTASYLLDVGGTAAVRELCINGDCQTAWPSSANITGRGVNATAAYGLQGFDFLANGSTVGYAIADQTQSGQPQAVNATLNVNGSVNISLVVPTTTSDEVLGWNGSAFTERNVTSGSGNINGTDISPNRIFLTTGTNAIYTSTVFSFPPDNQTHVTLNGANNTVMLRLRKTGTGTADFLQIQDVNNNSLFKVNSTGAVGIRRNASTLTAMLDVAGNATFSSEVSAPEICLAGDCRTAWPSGGGGGLSGGVADQPAVYTNATNAVARLINRSMMNITNTGVSGQVLGWASAGQMTWVDQTSFVYSNFFNQNLNTTNSPTFVKVNTAGLQATSSAGLLVESSTGIDVVDFGSANTNNTAFYGDVSIASGENLCLGGDCRSSWPSGGSGSNVSSHGTMQFGYVAPAFNSTHLNGSIRTLYIDDEGAVFTGSFALRTSLDRDTMFIGDYGAGAGRIDFMLPNSSVSALWGSQEWPSYYLDDFRVDALTLTFRGNTTVSDGNKFQAPALELRNSTGHNVTFFSNATCAGFRNPTTGAVLCL